MARGFNYAPGASAEVEEAGQPGLHRTQVAVLAGSKNVLVRAAVAARPDLPLGLLVTLAHDRATEVRAAIGANPTATPPIMEHLLGDKQVTVLEALLSNPSLSPALVERLAFHRRAEVRHAAAARLNEAPEAPAPPPVTLAAVPEIQDHVVIGFPAPEPEPAAELPARPTRTAPIRGFRIPGA
ncbi:hypothetical protein [Demequina sp. NBRC 110057]|uniref:hypothetical protein n=1 Tax=Demequina sp. NBRC 110057 TaxID=1570346 RepID=UPI0013564647|nr:hypothetical protein [Demequina sp. NBRC 110057]